MKTKKYFLICVTIFVILLLLMIKIAFSETIDVGSAAINRADAISGGKTLIDKNNPANASGVINHIEIYMNWGGTTVEVASFYEGSANVFSTRGATGVLNVVTGLNTFNAPGDFTAFNINASDYIGIYIVGAGYYIEQDLVGAGCWRATGDNIPCTNVTFTFYATQTFSLYATGSTGEAPPEVGVQPFILILE